MAKVTSKPAGDTIRVVPSRPQKAAGRAALPLRVFNQASVRHGARSSARPANRARERGWSREDLYSRGRLVDTNIFVYRFDDRFRDKQEVATNLLRKGIIDDSLRVPHQERLSLAQGLDTSQYL